MAGKIKNILFIMFDQLRWDYLSCSGHPHLHTPNIDSLAEDGVRFTRAYVQSPVCGSSRMSFYTGRYVHSHGSTWNRVPLKVGERTMGEHLRNVGMDCVLVGKTHMLADEEGMARLGIPKDSVIGVRQAECGFDVFERDDGMRPEGPDGFYDDHGAEEYNKWLQDRGYDGENPWHDYANSSRDAEGKLLSGWFLKNARQAAHIKEEDSETPYMTSRGIEFIEQSGDKPWCMHLSYIKPHWPYIVPAPYNSMYSPEHVVPVNRAHSEKENQHPIFEAFSHGRVSQTFWRQEVLDTVIPSYMGLIKQCDDQMGRLFDYLKKSGRWDETLIVVTSDHGDYLGDHWMAEKDLFHDCSAKVPLIIRDPRKQADSTRGSTCDELVEAIDLAPTFLEAAGGEAIPHILEGRSLMPFLEGLTPDDWREFAISENDYGITPGMASYSEHQTDPRQFMVTDKRWKYIYAENHRPMLFDLENDPKELIDLGTSEAHSHIRDMMFERLSLWARRLSQRVTMSHQDVQVEKARSGRRGIVLGAWDESELPSDITQCYVDPSVKL